MEKKIMVFSVFLACGSPPDERQHAIGFDDSPQNSDVVTSNNSDDASGSSSSSSSSSSGTGAGGSDDSNNGQSGVNADISVSGMIDLDVEFVFRSGPFVVVAPDGTFQNIPDQDLGDLDHYNLFYVAWVLDGANACHMPYVLNADSVQFYSEINQVTIVRPCHREIELPIPECDEPDEICHRHSVVYNLTD